MSEENEKQAKPAATKPAEKKDAPKKAKADKAADKPEAASKEKAAKAEKSADKPASEKSGEKPAKADSKSASKPAKPAKPAKAAKKAKNEEGVKKQGKLVADHRFYDVIQRPVITEKSTAAAEFNKVVFEIAPGADKTQVKAAVEALFAVKVLKVNTMITKGKQKKFRGRLGVRSDKRKAIVTLAAGQTIDLAAGLK